MGRPSHPAVADDPILAHLFTELTGRQGCHTVILYGSRARGDFTAESDYDVVGIRGSGEEYRIGETFAGKYLDGFVYPEARITEKEEDFLRLHGGVVLVEQGNYGTRLLERIATRVAAGPTKMSPRERAAQITWVRKTVDRTRRGDIEGDFRRVWLLHELLAFHFEVRDRWYRGPKEAFRELEKTDPETFRLYREALRPGADDSSLEALVGRVLTRVTELSP